MSTDSNLLTSPTSSTSIASDVLTALRNLDPFFRAHADENEAQGNVAPEVFTALSTLGVPYAYAPRSVGGLELSTTEATRVFEQIAYSDASTGWVAFVTASATGMAAGYMSDEAVHRVFSQPKPSILAGAGAPTGTAVAVDGGYRLTGRWSYGSGIQHADLVHAGAILVEDGKPRLDEDGKPEIMVLHARREDVVLAGNWDTLGLRGSGSVDYVVEDAFVPEDLVFSLKNAVPLRRSSFYQIGVINLNAIGHAAWAAGIGRRVLDEIALFAQERAGKPGGLADSASFWEKYGLAEGRYRAARALLYDVWNSVDDLVAAGATFETKDTTSIRIALHMITSAAREAAEFAYLSAGGTSLRSGDLQRLFRDAHSGSQHVTVSPGVLAAAGRNAAGLSGSKVWALYDLADPA